MVETLSDGQALLPDKGPETLKPQRRRGQRKEREKRPYLVHLPWHGSLVFRPDLIWSRAKAERFKLGEKLKV
jgi:hypothetical protein